MSLRDLIREFVNEIVLTTPAQSWVSKPPPPWIEDEEVDPQQDITLQDVAFEPKAQKQFKMPEQPRQSDLDYYDLGYPVNPVNYRDR